MDAVKENLWKALRHQDPDWVPNEMENTVYVQGPLVERPAGAGYDDFGCYWDAEGDEADDTYPSPNGYPIKDIEEFEKYLKIPDLSKLDWSAAEAKAKSLDRNVMTVGAVTTMGLFERSYLLLGMENALVNYLIEPDLMKDLIHRIAEHKIDYIQEYARHVHPEIFCYGDDWGTQSNLFMPVETWEDIIMPETIRIIDTMKSLGVFVELHSCGKIELVLHHAVDMGIQMWGPCQPCNDLPLMKKKFGDRLTFRGGIDSQFVLGKEGVTAEEIVREVDYRIETMSARGGYIAGPSHGLPYDPAMIRVMHDEIRRKGREVYAAPMDT